MTDFTERRTRAALLAVLLIVPFAVQAQQAGKDAQAVEDYLDSVSRLYEGLEYERALQQIEQAKRISPGVEATVALMLYEGIILAEMIRMDDATESFRAALFLRPDAKLPVKVSPKLERRFEFIRIEVKQELEFLRDRREAKRQQEESMGQGETTQAAPQPMEDIAPPREMEVTSARESRSRALIPAIAGGVLVVAGGVSYGLARSEQSKLRGDDPGLVTRADAHASASRGKTLQTVGLGLAGAGVVGLGVAAGMYLLGGPSRPLALGVGTDGTSAFVHGSWE